MKTRPSLVCGLLGGAALVASACGSVSSDSSRSGSGSATAGAGGALAASTGNGDGTTASGVTTSGMGGAGTSSSSSNISGSSSSGGSTSSTTTSSSTGPACPDADGDGVTTCQGDCDDGDPSIHPGAPEICGDGKDNDCNNVIDDGCPGLGTFVSASTGDDANPGTQAMPVKTIAVGILHAQALGNGVAVYVAKGDYPEDVVVVEGISLHGGYDPATWALDPKNNDTAILSQGAAGVYADKTITRMTVIDGFRLEGADGVSMMNRGSAITLDGGSPTLKNDIIDGPDEGAGADSHAILILAPSNDPKGALISGNSINGGAAGSSTYGIAFRSSTNPPPAPGSIAEISGNTIKGGAGRSSAGIAWFQGGDGTLIIDNDITAGSATATLNGGGESTGIVVAGNVLLGHITIDSNRINVDQANVGSCTPSNSPPPWCNGIDSAGAKATIVNNVVFGPKSAKSAGVWLHNSGIGLLDAVILSSNYVDGGGSPNAPQSTSAAVVLTLSIGVAGTVGRIRNDILAGGQGAARYGVYEDSPAGKSCTFEKLENDDFFLNPATDVLYRTWSGAAGANVTTIAALNMLSPGNAAASFAGDPTVDGTFHLKAGSPCIDTGTATEAPATDFEGDARPKGAGYDVGPDEH